MWLNEWMIFNKGIVQMNVLNQPQSDHKLVHIWFLEIALLCVGLCAYVCVCVCVCVAAPETINNQ